MVRLDIRGATFPGETGLSSQVLKTLMSKEGEKMKKAVSQGSKSLVKEDGVGSHEEQK